MTPLIHTIEVGEIIGARRWRINIGRKQMLKGVSIPSLPLFNTIFTPDTICSPCEIIEIPSFALVSGPVHLPTIWPRTGNLKAACVPNHNGEASVRSCVDECGAPCTQRMRAFQQSLYEECPCGIYAWNSVGLLLEIRRGLHTPCGHYVVGLVALSGRVIEHSQGYRAEFARPVALLGTAYSHTKRLAEKYEVSLLGDIGKLAMALLTRERERDGESPPCP